MTNKITTPDQSETAFTIDLDGIVDGDASQSNSVSNTNDYPKAMVGVVVKTGAVAPDDGSSFIVYLFRRMTNVQDDNASSSAGAITPQNAVVLGSIKVTDDTATTYEKIFMTEHLGDLGPEWGIFVKNATGATNDNSTPSVQGAWFRYLVPELQEP